MIILGIDPGTATTGYGIIRITDDGLVPMKFDLIETNKNHNPGKRLLSIHEQLQYVIKKYKPEYIAVEKVFFATNRKTAMRVGQAIGVILMVAAEANIPMTEYAPGTIKKRVAGHGRADKDDIQKSVKKKLGRHIKASKNKKTHFDNAADALAVALCHIYHEHPHHDPYAETTKSKAKKKK